MPNPQSIVPILNPTNLRNPWISESQLWGQDNAEAKFEVSARTALYNYSIPVGLAHANRRPRTARPERPPMVRTPGSLGFFEKTAKNCCKKVRLKNEKVAIFVPFRLIWLLRQNRAKKIWKININSKIIRCSKKCNKPYWFPEKHPKCDKKNEL